MNQIDNIGEWQRDFVIIAFDRGMRVATLGSQPAPWMIKGLQAIEDGKTLTVEMIKQFNS